MPVFQAFNAFTFRLLQSTPCTTCRSVQLRRMSPTDVHNSAVEKKALAKVATITTTTTTITEQKSVVTTNKRSGRKQTKSRQRKTRNNKVEQQRNERDEGVAEGLLLK
uniref:Uncharacterized protein n=1 Tax=Ceratitis capitata TaxID=7213 RepID=W8BWU6_CERCA